MNPSKENAEMAKEAFTRIMSGGTRVYEEDDSKFIEEFLEAAKKKLPSEEAIARDKARPRKKKLNVLNQ